MCNPPDDEIGPARPAGFFRLLWDRLFGRPAGPPAPPAEPEPEPSPEADARLEAFLDQRARSRGIPMCAKCGSRRDADGGVLHRRWCGSCDLEWIEDTICWPLAARMGRKAARELLKAVVRGELRLSDRKSAL
jgi:hypothetical protein